MNLDKNKTALLVMDFENDMVHEKGKLAGMGMAAHAKEQHALENTRKALDKARSAGVKVIFVTVSHEPGYPDLKDSKTPMYAGLTQSNVLIKGTWGAQIHDLLAPKSGERIINKMRISPFTNKEFEKELKGIDTLLLTGVATNYVVEATAREASDRDFRVIILEDCCASINKEMHDFTLKNVLPGLATISSSAEIIKAL